jgi:RNA polymerase subunit RPABC4/transcription elongation factor Spt4
MKGNNTIAEILKAFALICYIGGFIAGLVFGRAESSTSLYSSHTEFSFTLALIYWMAFFVSGTVWLGFAEIINLLQRLVDDGHSYKLNLKGNLEQSPIKTTIHTGAIKYRICLKCHRTNLYDAKVCEECGAELSGITSSVKEIQQDKGKICPKCHEFNPSGRFYCSICGEKLNG